MIESRKGDFMWSINYYRGLTLQEALIMAYMNSIETPPTALPL
jgi:hypothetical protein